MVCMKKLLKIGDKIYGQSLQRTTDSYFGGFPQREQFLFQNLKNKCQIHFFRHPVLSNLSEVFIHQKRLNKFLATLKFDYFLIDNPLSMLLLDQKIETPIIFDCIDWYDEMYLKEFGVDGRYYLLRYGLLRLLEKAAKVVTQSPIILDYLQKWGLKTQDTCVVPNGFDKRLFYPYLQRRVAGLKEKFSRLYHCDLSNKEIIVYTGKLSAWYQDIELIISAIDSHQIFFIVGDGPLLPQLPDRPNIIKTGQVPLVQVPDYTNIADAVVFPVSIDCSPIAVSEYLAVGKPIVMGKGRMEWLLKDGVNGSMVNGNTVAWKHGLAYAIENKKRMSKTNLKLSRNLSWDKLADKFLAFIEK